LEETLKHPIDPGPNSLSTFFFDGNWQVPCLCIKKDRRNIVSYKLSARAEQQKKRLPALTYRLQGAGKHKSRKRPDETEGTGEASQRGKLPETQRSTTAAGNLAWLADKAHSSSTSKPLSKFQNKVLIV
jgi:hypothetical protein